MVAAEAVTTEAGVAVIVVADAAEIEVVTEAATEAEAATVTDRAVAETRVPVPFALLAPVPVRCLLVLGR